MIVHKYGAARRARGPRRSGPVRCGQVDPLAWLVALDLAGAWPYRRRVRIVDATTCLVTNDPQFPGRPRP